ncbi:hypothetical protein [Algirhabdus cladophorae]|uniref:hypothetical protein n=1 Tax=Algirhabdus cladophorae TaxID=3377108 RepID=UPI003B84B0B7
MELRGFSQSATDLARELESLEVTPERVRASGIEVVSQIIEKAKEVSSPSQSMHLGGDTWYWNFQEMGEAYQFALALLNGFKRSALEQGLYYLKPSMAIGFGDPKFDGPRFLDDASIETYKKADGGRSYTLFAVENAIAELATIGVPMAPHPKFSDDPNVRHIVWTKEPDPQSGEPALEISLPKLLLDSEVIYSETASGALANIVRQQERSGSALVFGGPGSLDDPVFRSYISNTIALLRSEKEVSLTVISYLPLNEIQSSYAWLELCRQMQIEFSDSFAFSAFAIPKGQLRPFSYHIYDHETVHIGLRAYSPQKGTPTLSSSIMLKNAKIAERFETEFMEHYRSLGQLSDKKYAELLGEMEGISNSEKNRVLKSVNEILGRISH